MSVRSDIRVFISYVREDIAAADRLYADLRREGFAPWIDSENLRPGEDWREAIADAIRQSSFFIALLSSRSLAKRGYAQKELKTALDMLSEIPPGDIFLIPARVEPCESRDERLNRLHRIDLFPIWDAAVRKIATTMRPGFGAPPVVATADTCPNCMARLGPADEHCRTCGHLPDPNVRQALAERDALDMRYRAALAGAKTSLTIDSLGDLPAVIPVTLAAASKLFSEESTLYTAYATADQFRLQKQSRIRDVVDAMLFPAYGGQLLFGFVPLKTHLPSLYGDIYLILRESLIAKRTTVLERSSFEIAQSNLGGAPPKGLRSTWDERYKLAAIRMAEGLDTEPLECHIYGGITVHTVDVVSIPESRAHDIFVRNLIERAQRANVRVVFRQNGEFTSPRPNSR